MNIDHYVKEEGNSFLLILIEELNAKTINIPNENRNPLRLLMNMNRLVKNSKLIINTISKMNISFSSNLWDLLFFSYFAVIFETVVLENDSIPFSNI